MKKLLLISLALALCFVFGFSTAEMQINLEEEIKDLDLTEEFKEAVADGTVGVTHIGSFVVTTVVPEGYTYTENWRDDLLYIGELRSEDTTKPRIDVTIAYNDEYSDVTLTEISDEYLDELRAVAGVEEDDQAVQISTAVTEYGTGLVIYRTNTEYESTVEIATLYKGYEVSLFMYPGVDAEQGITDEEIENVITFISNMWILDRE